MTRVYLATKHFKMYLLNDMYNSYVQLLTDAKKRHKKLKFITNMKFKRIFMYVMTLTVFIALSFYKNHPLSYPFRTS